MFHTNEGCFCKLPQQRWSESIFPDLQTPPSRAPAPCAYWESLQDKDRFFSDMTADPSWCRPSSISWIKRSGLLQSGREGGWHPHHLPWKDLSLQVSDVMRTYIGRGLNPVLETWDSVDSLFRPLTKLHNLLRFFFIVIFLSWIKWDQSICIKLASLNKYTIKREKQQSVTVWLRASPG